jgi:hypothetical protein
MSRERIINSLTTCSLDYFESKSSNKCEFDLQWFVKKMKMNILLHLYCLHCFHLILGYIIIVTCTRIARQQLAEHIPAKRTNAT